MLCHSQVSVPKELNVGEKEIYIFIKVIMTILKFLSFFPKIQESNLCLNVHTLTFLEASDSCIALCLNVLKEYYGHIREKKYIPNNF